MSSNDLAQRYFQAWLDRDGDAVLRTLSPHGTYQDPSTGGPISGDRLRAYLSSLWSTFPDLTFQVESMAQTAPDRVAAQWTMRGTNTGSLMGLPPTGRSVVLRGADFFVLSDDRIHSVTGYFDSAEIPRQLGLQITIQPQQIGPFRFGTSLAVQTGKTQAPGAFSITSLDACSSEAVERVREGSRTSLIDMLAMDGFIGATTAAIGNRLVTVSAWDSPESSRRVMREGAHARIMHEIYDGSLAKHSYTSVWTNHRYGPVLVRCDSCGAMTRGPDENRMCRCGERLPDPIPYW